MIPWGEAINPDAHTLPSPRSRGARGQGSSHELQKNARTEGKRATQDEKTPPIFINAREPNCSKKPMNKYKKEAKANGRLRCLASLQVFSSVWS